MSPCLKALSASLQKQQITTHTIRGLLLTIIHLIRIRRTATVTIHAPRIITAQIHARRTTTAPIRDRTYQARHRRLCQIHAHQLRTVPIRGRMYQARHRRRCRILARRTTTAPIRGRTYQVRHQRRCRILAHQPRTVLTPGQRLHRHTDKRKSAEITIAQRILFICSLFSFSHVSREDLSTIWKRAFPAWGCPNGRHQHPGQRGRCWRLMGHQSGPKHRTIENLRT